MAKAKNPTTLSPAQQKFMGDGLLQRTTDLIAIGRSLQTIQKDLQTAQKDLRTVYARIFKMSRRLRGSRRGA